MKSTLTIGEVAARTGVAAHVLRHWETVGLLEPARVSGRRRYADEDCVRVAMILRAKAADLTLAQIGAVLTGSDRSVLRAHRTELEQRIARLQAAHTMVTHAIECENKSLVDCCRARVAA